MTGLWAADDMGPDQHATVRTEHDVIGFVTRTCFKTGPPGRVGIESEWFLHPSRPDLPEHDRLHRLTEDPPAPPADPKPCPAGPTRSRAAAGSPSSRAGS